MFFLITLLRFSPLWAQKNLKDSLERLLPSTTDTLRVRVLSELVWANRLTKPIEALEYSKEGLDLAYRLDDYVGLADLYNRSGVVYRNLGDYSQALQYYTQALQYAQKIRDPRQTAYAFNNIGGIYTLQESYALAIENSQKAIRSFDSLGDQRGISFCLINMGINYRKLKEYGKAIESFEKCLEIRKHWKNAHTEILACYFQLGETYLEKKDYNRAKKYFYSAYQDHKEVGENGFSGIFNSIGIVYFRENRLDSALFFAERALKTAKASHSKERIRNASKTLSQIYLEKRDFVKAYDYLYLQMEYKDSLQYEENSRLLSNYTLNQKQKELDLANKERRLREIELEEKKLQMYFFILLIAFLTFSVFAFIWTARIRKKKNTLLKSINRELLSKNEEISSQKEEIEKQKGEIEKNSQNITASIMYGKRIQEAMLPARNLINESLPEYFIWYKPRDIVSGDFYWFAEKTDSVITVVADCTGHGVPGAFMSTIGDSLLNKIIHDQETHSPEKILEALHWQVRQTLKQDETHSKDGMDIVILVLYKTKTKGKYHKVEYAGAMNPIIYLKNGELHEIKATKKAIGGVVEAQHLEYQKHTIEITSPTMFYLFSDGFQDQFGGDDDKKFMIKRLRQLFEMVWQLPAIDQNKYLEATFQEWTRNGRYSQIDDILVWGMRISHE